MGMTDSQYKGILIDAREDWEEMLKLLALWDGPDAVKAKEWAKQQIAKIDEKLKV